MIKIDKIKIKGFRKIKTATVELSPGVNVFMGHNESGKTSLEDAIIYALTDEIHSRPKAEFVEAVNSQCKTTSVTITGIGSDKPFTIKRTLAKTNRSGLSPIEVAVTLGVDPNVLSVCLNSNHYFDLSPADQKRLIIKALGLQPTFEGTFDILEEQGYAGNVCEEFWNEEIIKEISLKGWDAGHKLAFDLRRDAGRETKILGNDQPELLAFVTLDGMKVPIEKILETHKEKPLSEREKNYRLELKEIHEKIGGMTAISSKEKEEAEKDLAEHEKERIVLERISSWTNKDSAQLLELREKKQDFNEKKQADLEKLDRLINESEDILAKNKKEWVGTLKCLQPNESGHQICPANTPDWKDQQEGIDELQNKYDVLEDSVFPDQEALGAITEKGQQCKDAQARIKVLESFIGRINATLQNSKPENTDNIEKLKTSIAGIERKIEHLRIAKEALDHNRTATAFLSDRSIRATEVNAKHEHYDNLCKALSPDGIPGELAAEKLSALNARLKEHSEMMGVEVLFLDNLSLVQAGDRQLWTLGGAETSRVRIALSEALSHISGVGLLLLDELNISVADDNARVRAWLVEMGKETQILAIAATNAPEAPKIKKGGPVKVFWVEDGMFRKLEE